MLLTESQRSFYLERGYLILDNIFSPEEIDECSETYDELFAAKLETKTNLEATWAGTWKTQNQAQKNAGQEDGQHGESENSQTGSTSVLSIHNLQCHSSVFTKMLLNEKLLDVVSQLIQSSNILLHHTKAHIKPPQIGSPFPTHQDYHYFPFKNDTMVAVFIHLDDSDPENGGLAIFPGSHKLGPLENKSNVSTHFYVDQEKFPLCHAVPVHAKRGQIVIFSYLLVHGSYPNVSNRNRRMLLFQLMSADDEPLKGIHKSPCHGLVLRGKNNHVDADINKRHA